MFCQNCGTSLPDDSKFCHACGAKIGGSKTVASHETVDRPREDSGDMKVVWIVLGLVAVAAVVFVLLASPCVIFGHKWLDANCLIPKTCSVCWETEGFSLEHPWNEATCDTPKTCSYCGRTEGEPLGHDWTEATCTSLSRCTRCNDARGSVLAHNWIEATETSPRRCTGCNAMQPLPRPETGEVFIGKDKTRSSTLLVKNESDLDCYGILKNTEFEDVYSFYVRANDSKHISVPSGQFYLFYSRGTDWYGPEYYFGEGTEPVSDNEIKDFNKYWWTSTFT